ncbi:hypothetical protein RchiOBHm_Chr6g0269701 [Rosa chinensis]|uniref:Uncharacterized protein n=1 Tax=Rosa chinensis TaxID=74649 RepID=A0A2P6PQI3_ROSCH|nr:hypothetical protein RchiOBHm_Chr6g0269701 [Rosa chinensis]
MIMKNHTNINTILVPFIFFFVLFSWIFIAMKAQNTTIRVNVGVILDFDSGSKKTDKFYWSCMNLALSDFYASNPHYKTRLVLLPGNSRGTIVGAAAAVYGCSTYVNGGTSIPFQGRALYKASMCCSLVVFINLNVVHSTKSNNLVVSDELLIKLFKINMSVYFLLGSFSSSSFFLLKKKKVTKSPNQ